MTEEFLGREEALKAVKESMEMYGKYIVEGLQK